MRDARCAMRDARCVISKKTQNLAVNSDQDSEHYDLIPILTLHALRVTHHVRLLLRHSHKRRHIIRLAATNYFVRFFAAVDVRDFYFVFAFAWHVLIGQEVVT